MNSLANACALMGTVAAAVAAPVDHVIIAAMSLSEQPNYSWSSSIDDHAASYTIEGKTTSDGVTWVRMPMVRSVSRGLGRQSTTELEALFFSGGLGAVRIDDDWRTPGELKARAERSVRRPGPMVRGSASAGSFGIVGGTPLGAAAPFLEDRRGSQYDALQLGVTHPHEELAIVIGSYATMEVEGETITGALTETGAAVLLVRAEQTDLEPLAAAGTFKLWLQHGRVVRYQLRLEGIVAEDRWSRKRVERNSITALREIGSTRVAVPQAIATKLSL